MDIPTPDIDFSLITLSTWVKGLAVLIIGFITASFTSALIGKTLAKHTSTHYTLLVKRITYYSTLFTFLIFFLFTLDLDIHALGITGILLVALGFASKPAMVNILSGLFLVFERPFVVGDLLQLDDITGEVLSIDLLSIKLRTLDNTLLRVPNEILLNTQFKNTSRFPIRRLEISLSLAIKQDMDQINALLLKVATNNPLSLESPPPQLLFKSFGSNIIEVKFIVWSTRDSYFALKDTLPFEIQRAMQQQDIELPKTSHELHLTDQQLTSKLIE